MAIYFLKYLGTHTGYGFRDSEIYFYSWQRESPVAYGILAPWPDPGLNVCFLHWPADSLPLDPQGSPRKALVAQSCLTLRDPVDCSPPGSSVRGILQARRLEWVAIPFSRGSSQPRVRTCVSCISWIGKRILYHWATWEALQCDVRYAKYFELW